MLHFNELRMTSDSKSLIIDVSVDMEDYYKDVIIDSIYIDTQDTFVTNGPSSKPIFKYIVEEGLSPVYANNLNTPIYKEDSRIYVEDTKQRKHIRLVIDLKELKTESNNMFFIYVRATGTPTPDTPCSYDRSLIIGTIVDLNIILKQSMGYIKQLGDTCQIPQGFINKILLTKSLELLLQTGNYLEAIKYWKKHFMNDLVVNNTGCGCNGIN